MEYVINRSERPVYLQIYRRIRDGIIGGVYPRGSRLPSKRLFAEECGVSTVTVEHAYALLCDEGYVESRERSGFFVIFRPADGFAAAAATHSPAHEARRAYVADYPEFSVSVLSRTMRRVLTDCGDMILERSPGTGREELREAIRQYLARNRGIKADTAQIVVGSGAEYLYGLITELLGRDRIYAIESPSYEKIERIYRVSGAEYRLLPLAEDGIDSDALATSDADVLHVTPYRSFPSGVTASASKRHEYIRWAGRSGRYIIESDYGSEFSVASQPLETLFVLSHDGNVIYLNTFSKTISPSMRVGYMVLPSGLTEAFYEKLGFYSCTVPTFEQLVLAELIDGGDFERHINRVRRKIRRESGDQM